ncbi:hypothetical protein ACFW1A_23655 [Kitasatospora sp. NPDC058965]|uniref:hypothetical protein n=1 Tax=Kitasatospora sp. NPDC058965 TaxID=3346682 RepID=UPI0036818967
MGTGSDNTTDSHRAIVTSLLDTKAVDFTAIGNALAKFGPALALSGEDGFCGTGQHFVRVFRPSTSGGPLDSAAQLRAVGQELTD